MLFENFDKKVKEAAERHHPTYDENAWAKMEKLLDKHMPVEENRRKRFLFILFLLAALGVAGLLVVQPWKTSTDKLVAKETNHSPEPVSSQQPDQKPVQNENPIQPTIPVDKRRDVVNEKVMISNQQHQNKNSFQLDPSRRHKGYVSKKDNQVSANEKEKPLLSVNEPPKLPVDETKRDNLKSDVIETVNNKVVEEAKKATEVAAVKEQKNVNPLNTMDSDPEKKQVSPNLLKSKKKRTHALLLTAGGGPDISFVTGGDPGTVKLFGGAGIGYVYNNRISVRTGFYSGRKIYSAEPGDYNPPPGFTMYYPNLQKVDANCKIYEVPIAVGYHFGNKNRPFFVSAAVSSFFMKEETYNYYYKYTPTGPTVSRERSIYDVNKHYFAGLGISGGYTHHFTPRISLTVEPYAKLPLKGVGYGKVKLNSAGILFSAGFQPFGSKKK